MHIYWQFSLPLLGMAVLFLIVYILLLMPIVFLNNVFLFGGGSFSDTRREIGNSLTLWLFFYPIMAVFSIVKYGLALGWTAYCSARTAEYIRLPETLTHWGYFLTGFILCGLPFCYVALKERRGALGSSIAVVVFLAGFIGFSLWPDSIDSVFGWLLKTPYMMKIKAEAPDWL